MVEYLYGDEDGHLDYEYFEDGLNEICNAGGWRGTRKYKQRRRKKETAVMAMETTARMAAEATATAILKTMMIDNGGGRWKQYRR